MVHSIPHYRPRQHTTIQNIYINGGYGGYGQYAYSRAPLFMQPAPYERAAEIQAEAMKEGVKWGGISNLISTIGNTFSTIWGAIKGTGSTSP